MKEPKMIWLSNPGSECQHPAEAIQTGGPVPGTREVLPHICMACGAELPVNTWAEIIITQEPDSTASSGDVKP
jgi:hypothetical protein